jgi:hypothetical protein
MSTMDEAITTSAASGEVQGRYQVVVARLWDTGVHRDAP